MPSEPVRHAATRYWSMLPDLVRRYEAARAADEAMLAIPAGKHAEYDAAVAESREANEALHRVLQLVEDPRRITLAAAKRYELDLQPFAVSVGGLARDAEAADRLRGLAKRVAVEAEAAKANTPTEADAPETQPTDTAPEQAKAKGRRTRAKWEAEAMVLVRDNPEWSDAKIAKEVSINPSTLSRSDTYQQAAAVARSKRTAVKGHVRATDETRDVEGYAEATDPADMDWD